MRLSIHVKRGKDHVRETERRMVIDTGEDCTPSRLIAEIGSVIRQAHTDDGDVIQVFAAVSYPVATQDTSAGERQLAPESVMSTTNH